MKILLDGLNGRYKMTKEKKITLKIEQEKLCNPKEHGREKEVSETVECFLAGQ